MLTVASGDERNFIAFELHRDLDLTTARNVINECALTYRKANISTHAVHRSAMMTIKITR